MLTIMVSSGKMQYDATIAYLKGVAILLMVLAHCSQSVIYCYTVYMFHMALFFIVSGFCLKEKYIEAPFLFMVALCEMVFDISIFSQFIS